MVRVLAAAAYRNDELYRYSLNRWGHEQAERYLRGLFATAAKIETNRVASRPIPAAFGVDGYVCRYERHYIYWRKLENGDIGIVTVLHERMHQFARFQDDIRL